MTRDCKHGMLARSCEVCRLDAEVVRYLGRLQEAHVQRDALLVEAARLRAALEQYVADDEFVYGVGHTERSKVGRAALGDALDVVHTCPETSRPNVFDLACLACVAALREHGFEALTAKREP